MKYVTPSVRKTAFNCPHCHVLTTQFWYSAHAHRLEKDNLPFVVGPDNREEYRFDDIKDTEQRKRLGEWVDKVATGKPMFESHSEYRNLDVTNLHFSKCYECTRIAVWIADKLVYPATGTAPPVNVDTPDDIKADYNEASSILATSPRGAAALLRLAIQKLCKELGQPGRNINSDIGSLVSGGLDRRIQKALDVLRVIGNDAVHPGQIDLRDSLETAEGLFRLFNLIVEKMISEPKHIEEMYGQLPPEKLQQIEERDKRRAEEA
ncbi:DUF4145 domain-containing protein [Sinorhizobium sp. 7-81]|uniref:DUF4145 domain-containing protein n=1 Tax=Sinorhizobium sp. 8-89 TaxID=3049089 RepID=UPI0024C46F94|nr:DUF4145 domain-containing protein [Sinorhizobium sp. 8-89]MDK1489409.1 DUF4145 domain-containing protein [Sinorhizobium sp. 8-89]